MHDRPAREPHSRTRFRMDAGSCAISTLTRVGLLCLPVMCNAQMVGPTPQPPGIPVTPEEVEQVQPENWAIHGQATNVWLLQSQRSGHLTRERTASVLTRTAGKPST